jgi:hypothetical protein
MSWLIDHLTLISAIVAALGAVGAGVGTYLSQQDQTRLYQGLAAKSDEIASLSRDVAKKSEDIAELNRTIAALVTGGDSFCYLKLLPYKATEVELVVLHVGKYPISDVSIRFVDSDQLAGPPPPGMSVMDYFLRAEVNIPVGTLPIKGFRRVGRIQIPAGVVEKKYLAAFTARNGSWDQSIVLRKTKSGDWRVAVKILENPGQATFEEMNKPWKLLFHEAAPDFPFNSEHELQDWLGGQPTP